MRTSATLPTIVPPVPAASPPACRARGASQHDCAVRFRHLCQCDGQLRLPPGGWGVGCKEVFSILSASVPDWHRSSKPHPAGDSSTVASDLVPASFALHEPPLLPYVGLGCPAPPHLISPALQALSEVVPSLAAEMVAAGGFWVLRPDSGGQRVLGGSGALGGKVAGRALTSLLQDARRV